jgi:hypothetical protein
MLKVFQTIQDFSRDPRISEILRLQQIINDLSLLPESVSKLAPSCPSPAQTPSHNDRSSPPLPPLNHR